MFYESFITDSKEVQGNLVENGQISTTCNNGEINNENEVQTKSVNGFNSKVSATTKALKKFDRKLEENKKLKKTCK